MIAGAARFSGTDAAHGGDIHHFSPVLSHILLDHLPSHQPGAGDIGLHHPVPGLHRVVQIGVLALLLGAVEQDTGVVYQDVDAAEIRHDLPHCLDHVSFLAYIAVVGPDLPLCHLCNAESFLLRQLRLDINDGHIAALKGQRLHIFIAQSLGTAGNDSDLAAQIVFVHMYSSCLLIRLSLHSFVNQLTVLGVIIA